MMFDVVMSFSAFPGPLRFAIVGPVLRRTFASLVRSHSRDNLGAPSNPLSGDARCLPVSSVFLSSIPAARPLDPAATACHATTHRE